MLRLLIPSLFLVWFQAGLAAGDRQHFQPLDVFELEWATEPRVSPDGEQLVYVRNFMDVMNDRRRSNLWLIDLDSGQQRPLTSGTSNHWSPRWSPAGDRLAWFSSEAGDSQLWMHWMEAGASARITQLTESPGNLSWSPDGRWLALSLPVRTQREPLGEMPQKPDGAEWAEPVQFIDRMLYRADGAGYLEPSYRQLFLVPAEGGTPRQLTAGEFNHDTTPSWTPDGKALVLSANRHEEWQHQPLNSEVYRIDIESGKTTALTDRYGPDAAAAVSPDGRMIAYLGFDDRHQGYQLTRLYVMDTDGSRQRMISEAVERSIDDFAWSRDSRSLVIAYDDQGEGRLARLDLDGDLTALADQFGGTALGRPYGGGQFSVGPEGQVAYTLASAAHPADVALVDRRSREPQRLTRLNADLLGQRQLAEIEELWFESSHDGQRIQGWIAKPPGFDPEQRYPLILEIHGGPFANYGPRFAAEIQLYAAAGYLVLYTNPRGSTSYGEAFANAIHLAYPSHDYDDLMSGVDAVIERGYVDPDQLYITGGSGGGVLTAWSIGHTDRFRAAAVQKPVINWYSFALTADFYNFFHQYWFDAKPWEDPDQYLSRSPISHVGKVSTPTLVITGEADYRTPISESEQYYQALKIEKVPAAMVRIPGASHGIANRPSQLLAKVQNILGWFERYRGKDADGP